MRDDKYFLRKAQEWGDKRERPYNFGAVVVKDGEIISADHGHVQTTHNPSLHAEVSAIIKACQKLNSHNIDGCILYASHEPCMMCLSCAAWAHIDRIVYSVAASEQENVLYEFENFSAHEFAKRLPRKMKIEQLRLEEV